MKHAWIISLVWIASVAVPPSQAGGPGVYQQLMRAFRKPVGQALVRSKTGRALMRRFGVHYADDLAKVLAQANSRAARVARGQVRAKLKEMQAALDQFRAAKTARGIRFDKNRLSKRERALLGTLARRHSKQMRQVLTSSNSAMVHLPSSPALRARQMRQAFVQSGEGVQVAARNPANYRLPLRGSPAARALGRKEILGLWGKMRACAANQKDRSTNRNFMRFLFSSVGISETVTVVGTFFGKGLEDVGWQGLNVKGLKLIIETGMDKVTLDELGTDMIRTALASVVSAVSLKGKIPFRRRWQRFTIIGGTMSVADMVIYNFTEWNGRAGETDTVSSSTLSGEARLVEKPHPVARLGFNLGWTGAMSWKGALIYDVVMGMQCLYPNSRWVRHGLTSARLALDTVSSVAYFYFRNKMIGPHTSMDPHFTR